MSDETKPTTPSGTDSTETVEGAVLVAEVSDETGVQAEAVIATDFTHTVIVAAFANQESAMETYEALRDAEVSQSLHIDAVAVVRADAEGKIHAQKVTEHSTKKGLKWGVGGIEARAAACQRRRRELVPLRLDPQRVGAEPSQLTQRALARGGRGANQRGVVLENRPLPGAGARLRAPAATPAARERKPRDQRQAGAELPKSP